MKKQILQLLAFGAFFVSATASAHLVTIEMDTIGSSQEVYSEGGYTITAPTEHTHGFLYGPFNADKGMQLANDTIGMNLVEDFGVEFNILSMEILSLSGNGLHIQGLVGGIVDAAMDVLLTGADVGTYSFNGGWHGVDEVRFWFDSNGGYLTGTSSLADNFTFDKITVEDHVSAVPVPAAVWLFMSALGGLGAMRRKQALVA